MNSSLGQHKAKILLFSNYKENLTIQLHLYWILNKTKFYAVFPREKSCFSDSTTLLKAFHTNIFLKVGGFLFRKTYKRHA